MKVSHKYEAVLTKFEDLVEELRRSRNKHKKAKVPICFNESKNKHISFV
jgi:hypothetical protein